MARPVTRNHLGDLLRRQRLTSGLSGRSLAAAIGHSQSGVVRIEAGKAKISPELLQKWLQATGASQADRGQIESLFGELVKMEYGVRSAGATRGGRKGVLATLEGSASEICVWQFTSVPDLLQTGAYARSVLLMSAGDSDRDLDRQVAELISRQDILYTPGVVLKVVVSARVLGARFGNPYVMVDQLDRIASLVRRNRIDLSVLPSNVEVGANHGSAGGIYFGSHMSPGGLALSLGDRSPESDPSVVQRLKDDFTCYQRNSLRGEQAITAVEDIARRLAVEVGPP